MRHRKLQPKASEQHYPFAGKAVSFGEAFPTIEHIRAEVEPKLGRTVVLTEATMDEFVNCANPGCYGGGVRVAEFVRKMVADGKKDDEGDALCIGYEGSATRRRGDCLNFFQMRVHIDYRSNADADTVMGSGNAKV